MFTLTDGLIRRGYTDAETPEAWAEIFRRVIAEDLEFLQFAGICR